MAVTSIWPIKGRIAPVIEYARNPGKTIETSREQAAALHQIDGVLEYAANDMKTETREYVSGINCSEEYAAQQLQRIIHSGFGRCRCHHLGRCVD